VAVLDAYLEFLAVRSRSNTVAAVAYDLKVFFTVVGKPPPRVVAADVLGFVTAQYARGPARRLQPAGDGGGVSARTVRRQLSSVSGLFAFLHARRDVTANPVPRGLPTRRERQRPRQGVPLVRTPRTLPRILEPGQVDALLAALRTHRDRAMAGDGAGRTAPLRGTRPATDRCAGRRSAGVHRRGQGRPSATDPGLWPVLRLGGGLSGPGNGLQWP
jgi:integrase/recombinase XerD